MERIREVYVSNNFDVELSLDEIQTLIHMQQSDDDEDFEANGPISGGAP